MRRDQKKFFGELAIQLIVLLGAAVFVYGVRLAWRPGGWMVAGLVISVPALFVAYGNTRGRN